ncbi:hypothetical protein ACIBTZ_22280 [Micromonospora sp. NPDC049460]|uniref:hypothetical protein n=1 Tax=unclassified Micromonospora TaxID=2617518 RepID=UPI003716E5BD
MSTVAPVDWTELAPHLVDAVRRDRAWSLTVARELVAPGDRLAGDVGCGAAGMALAIARMLVCGRSSRWTRTGGPSWKPSAGGSADCGSPACSPPPTSTRGTGSSIRLTRSGRVTATT